MIPVCRRETASLSRQTVGSELDGWVERKSGWEARAVSVAPTESTLLNALSAIPELCDAEIASEDYAWRISASTPRSFSASLVSGICECRALL